MSAIAPASGSRAITADYATLCLSGSGFRATVFHLGAIRRLNELGLLRSVTAVHAVSGGGLSAGLLAHSWNRLLPDGAGRLIGYADMAQLADRFILRNHTLKPTLKSRLRPRNWRKLSQNSFSETDRLIEIFDDELFRNRLLVDLPADRTLFAWYATNLRTGGRWELSRSRVGETSLGYRYPDRLRLAEAVAATIVHPALMPPVTILSRTRDFDSTDRNSSDDLRRQALLTDGSMHDPLAVEPALGAGGTVIVCDGGSLLLPEPSYDDWIGGRMMRTISIQRYRAVESRRRWIVDAIRQGRIEGTYIALAAQHRDYGLGDSIGYSPSVAERIWRIPDGVEKLSMEEVALVSNHGYTIADAAVRRLLGHRLRGSVPLSPPYPEAPTDALDSPRLLEGKSSRRRRAA